ncbi:MAG: hypothetical protein ACUVQ7_06185 [bacterium]
MAKNSVDMQSGSVIKYTTGGGKSNIFERVKLSSSDLALHKAVIARAGTHSGDEGPHPKAQDGLVDLVFEADEGGVWPLFGEF